MNLPPFGFPNSIILIIVLISVSCNKTVKKEEGAKHHDNDSALVQLPEISDTLHTQKIKPDTVLISKSLQSFDVKIARVKDSMDIWGFREMTKQTLNSKSDYKRHWWLKIFFNDRKTTPSDRPEEKDWNSIIEIRQYHFKKAWEFVVEEWTLKDENSARNWLNIALKTYRIDNHKPPRIYWFEGNKLYFIMATAAVDWGNHINNLVLVFTGNTRLLVNVMNEPVRLVDYKKQKRGANGSPCNQKKYYFKPDTTGNYYQYFWFHNLRSKYKEEAIDGVKMLVYIYGEEIGNYDDHNEELISIKARINDSQLGALDIVGMQKNLLTESFGYKYLQREDFICYTHYKSVLIIHLKNQKVDWFHYIRLNKSINDIHELPKDLLSYDHDKEQP